MEPPLRWRFSRVSIRRTHRRRSTHRLKEPSVMPRLSIVAVAAVAFLFALAQPARAQLLPADAGDFMGAWTLVVDSPQGPFEQELTLKDEEGKVVAVITSQIQPDGQRITDVAKVGADLVMKFSGNFQGNAFDAKITVTATEAGKATVNLDGNNCQFVMSGSGTKKK